jgi:hypothetical protein
MNIVKVKYLKQYKLKLTFSNGKAKEVDLKDFLMKAQNPMTTRFRDVSLFKNVAIENGNLTWEDGEMDLSAEWLYNLQDSKKQAA